MDTVNARRPDIKARLAIMSPDQMSFGAQLALVRQSRVLVGFHGAAMAHLLFVHPHASVLELTLPRFAGRTNYAAMARGTGVTFMTHLLDSNCEEFLGQQINVPVDEFLEILSYHIPSPSSHKKQLVDPVLIDGAKAWNVAADLSSNRGTHRAEENPAQAGQQRAVVDDDFKSYSQGTSDGVGADSQSRKVMSQERRPVTSNSHHNGEREAAARAALRESHPSVHMRQIDVSNPISSDRSVSDSAAGHFANSVEQALLDMQRSIDENRRKQQEHI